MAKSTFGCSIFTKVYTFLSINNTLVLFIATVVYSYFLQKQVLGHSEWSTFKPFEHFRSTDIPNSSASNSGPQFHCSLAEHMKFHRYYFLKLDNLDAVSQ